MTESNVSTKLREALASLGAVVWKVSDRFHASRPDLLFFYNGVCGAIEVKVHPNKITKLQEHTLNDLYNQSIPTYVLTYFPMSKTILITMFNYGGPPAFHSIKEAAKWLSERHS